MITVAERFFQKVRAAAEGGCHIWGGARNVWGYGRLKRGGRMYAAHRVAWEMKCGPIPAGLLVLHRCDNRLCVNPDHLFLGTQYDNMCDMRAKGRFRRSGQAEFGMARVRRGRRKDQFALRLSPAMYEGLRAEAEAAGRGVGTLVRDILAAHTVHRSAERRQAEDRR
jgi:hypothetical protein